MCITQIALFSAGCGLAGVLLGAAITYGFALLLAQHNAQGDAGRRLREAFQPELAALDSAKNSKNVDVEQVLQEAWPRHYAAVSELMFHLPPKKRKGLQSAWEDYYLVGGSIRFFDYRFDGVEASRAKFRERVNAILAFTES